MNKLFTALSVICFVIMIVLIGMTFLTRDMNYQSNLLYPTSITFFLGTIFGLIAKNTGGGKGNDEK
ncbi:MAG: hypothetical protein IKS19_08450 [Clostridia bacterium]|nr:hypothetical protein [Clostridia bacterium]